MTERGLAESRSKAQALILAGQVKVVPPSQARPPLKSGSLLPENTEIEILKAPRFVSRGGEKLQPALEHWRVSVKDRVCLDVGASTGGFTDCLLQSGARRVYAVDVGHGQIHPKLRSDPRVLLYEKAHVLKWEPPWICRPHPAFPLPSTSLRASRAGKGEEKRIDKAPELDYKECAVPSLAVIDVSFISLKRVLARVGEILRSGRAAGFGAPCAEAKAEILALVKPQFEVGPQHVKKGIVKDETVRSQAVSKIMEHSAGLGFEIAGRFPCPLPGAKGNREEWIFLKGA